MRFHDLTGIYRDVEATVYKDDCCHVNALGNQLMAAGIREAILSWGDGAIGVGSAVPRLASAPVTGEGPNSAGVSEASYTGEQPPR